MKFQVHFIDNQQTFNQTMLTLLQHEWIGFDTEFVGEKTYIPILCLLQVVTKNDIFLVDTLKVKQLDTFLQLIENPAILKITHAGDNDYRLLHALFGTIPKNTFDTQIAAGFTGYSYPAGFAKICERELHISVAKSHTTADWEARPIEPRALDYAIEDVKYLPALHQKLSSKLAKLSRTDWVREENLKWEDPSFYKFDPYKEAFSSDLIYNLDMRDQIFLMRIYIWRREKAAQLNVPRDAILQNKHISTVVRAVKHGVNGFRSNRTLPEHVWKKYADEWEKLYNIGITDTEREVLQSLPASVPDEPEKDWLHELLYLLVKRACQQHDISAALLLPKGDFNKLRYNPSHFDYSLLEGWRANLLGEKLVDWLKKMRPVVVDWDGDVCKISMPLSASHD